MSQEKTSLTAALRHLAEQERRTPSEHATPGELTAYHEGTLPPPVEARVREHLAHCKLCSDLLLDLAGFADLAPPPGVPELTDAEVDEDWKTLRARMGEGEQKPATVVPFRPPTPAPARPSRDLFPWKVVAAAALMATLGLSVRVFQLTQEEQKGSEPRVVTPLNPRGQERGPAQELPGIPATEDRFLYLSPGPERDYDRYQIEVVRSEAGQRAEEVVTRTEIFEAPQDWIVPLLIPKGSLEPGSYKALLYGIEGDRKELSSTLAFKMDGS